MKVLIIQAGTPVNPEHYKGQKLQLEPTLTHGMQYFRYSEVLHNIQTRESLVAAGIDVDHVYFTGRKNFFNCLKAGWKVRQLGKQNGYDIVNQYWGGMSSFFTACFCKSVFVISFLGSDLYGRYLRNGRVSLPARAFRFFSRLTAIFADGVIVMSERMKSQLWTFTRGKSVVICEGIDPGKFYVVSQSEARLRLGWSQETPVVLFFPSEAYVKNTPLAMAAFERAKSSLPDARLVLVYNVPHGELIWHYNAADLLLLTSFYEGSNNSLKEALACNLPVVTVDVGDCTKRLSAVSPSSIVDRFDAAELAAAMVPILQSRTRSNGSSKVKDVTLPSIADQIIGYYASLSKVSH